MRKQAIFRITVIITLLLGVVLLAQGPLTPLFNLRVRTDASGYLITAASAYTAPDGPLTAFANLRGRTDANGYLLTTSSPSSGSTFYAGNGTICTAPSYSFANGLLDGFAWLSTGNVVYCASGSAILRFGQSSGITTGSNGMYGFANTTSASSGTLDTQITRVSANVVGVPAAWITQGTDTTAVQAGQVSQTRYQTSITPATAGATNCGPAFLAAALTADCTIATIPAGFRLKAIYADVTVGFTCSGTCTGTKVVQCGSSAGAVDVLAAGFTVAATGTAGLTDAQLGSAMVRAAAIQGGFLPSWSAPTGISCRFTSGTGNWGNAATTFVNAGAITFTLIGEQIK